MLDLVGAGLFALAILHTFSTRYFEHLAHTRTAHAGVWHLLGEVETVFGFWAFVLLVFMAFAYGWGTASAHLVATFVEPMSSSCSWSSPDPAIMQLRPTAPVAAMLLRPPGDRRYFLSLPRTPVGCCSPNPRRCPRRAHVARARSPLTPRAPKYPPSGIVRQHFRWLDLDDLASRRFHGCRQVDWTTDTCFRFSRKAPSPSSERLAVTCLFR